MKTTRQKQAQAGVRAARTRTPARPRPSAPKKRRDRRQVQPNDERLLTWSGKQLSERQHGGWLDETAQSDGARLRHLLDMQRGGERLTESERDEIRELTIRLRDKNETLGCGAEKVLALKNCVELVCRAVQETLKGDQEWGTLLGEMIPILAKRTERLKENKAFKARFSQIRPLQLARKKGKTLRNVIEGIIQDVTQKHRMFSLVGELRESYARCNLSELSSLSADIWFERVVLPELKHLPESYARCNLPEFSSLSVDIWFERAIWPELKQRKDELRDNPQIGGLGKANRTKGKRSGKFQLSDLKEQACNTVRSLAKAPRLYHFSDEIAST